MTGPEIVDAVARLAEDSALLDRYRDENVKLLRECDEARDEVERLRALLEQVQADAERIRARNFILCEEIKQLQPAAENEVLRSALAVRTTQCANHQSRADRLANEVRTVAERQREACAAAVDAHGVRSEWGALVRATPLVTEGDK